VAPVGHPAQLRTVVDVDLAGFPVLWAGGGDHHTMFSVTYDDLVRITGGQTAAIA
jgi:prolyl-tRNA editing enzyme YbaK/EbsC (Cys-tRNA(Pro) deacylase)